MQQEKANVTGDVLWMSWWGWWVKALIERQETPLSLSKDALGIKFMPNEEKKTIFIAFGKTST